MKTVAKNHNEVSETWAKQEQSHMRGNNMFFEYDTIYSYGYHFPIARHYKKYVLFTSRSYSTSTAQHKSIVRNALFGGLPVYIVDDVNQAPDTVELQRHNDITKDFCQKAKRARKNTDFYLECARQAQKDATALKARFHIKSDIYKVD